MKRAMKSSMRSYMSKRFLNTRKANHFTQAKFAEYLMKVGNLKGFQVCLWQTADGKIEDFGAAPWIPAPIARWNTARACVACSRSFSIWFSSARPQTYSSTSCEKSCSIRCALVIALPDGTIFKFPI